MGVWLAWGGLLASDVLPKALRQAQGERVGDKGFDGLGASGVLPKALRQAQGERNGAEGSIGLG